MATVKIRVDDTLKQKADALFSKPVSNSIQEAIADSRSRRNLHGPFDTAEDAVNSMFED